MTDGAALGVVYLVGAGPWQPDLLTVRGQSLLGRAEVVVHDYLANPAILEWAHTGAELICVGRPPDRLKQSEINALLVERGLAGQVVVRLKGGDPFVFGRGGEEAEALRMAGVAYEVVPGVTAAVAAAAFAGIPVTDRRFGSTLAICTGHQRADADSDLDWAALTRMDTLVIYMGARRLGAIAARLIEAGKPPSTPVAIVRWATRPDQVTQVTRLDGCAALSIRPPATIIIGPVVALRDRIAWFESRVLHGLRIVITRSQETQAGFNAQLAELGAEVIQLPTISIDSLGRTALVQKAIANLAQYDWILFTSANGVRHFLAAVRAAGLDARAFANARLGCIGPATARCLDAHGLRADLVPEEYVAEAFLDALLADGVVDQHILLPRARIAREVLPDRLRDAGAQVDIVPAYETTAPVPDAAVRARIAAGDVDLVTFTASSTVRHFRALFDADEWVEVCAHTAAACIGPITAATARDAGLRVVVSADTYTIPGLVDALSAWRRAKEA